MAKLVRAGLDLAHHAEIEGNRMSGLEGQSNIQQSSERPVGRAFNPGVPRSSGTARKGRKALTR